MLCLILAVGRLSRATNRRDRSASPDCRPVLNNIIIFLSLSLSSHSCVWWVGGHSNKLSPVSCAFSFLGGLKTVFNPPEFQFCASLHFNSGHQLNACGAEFCIFRRSFRICLLRQQPNDLPPMLMCVKIGKIRPVV